MSKKTGITQDTYQKLILDAGVVYADYGISGKQATILGATRGGSEFNVETEYKQVEVDGAPGPVVGDQRIVSVTATLTANFIEMSRQLLAMAVPGVETVGNSAQINTPMNNPYDEAGILIDNVNYYEIKRKLEKTLPNFRYFDNIVIAAELSGSKRPVICGIKNAIANSNLQLSFADKDESVLAITFRGSFDPNDLTEEPWFIRYPEDRTGA